MLSFGDYMLQRMYILVLETIFMPLILWLANVKITAFAIQVFQDGIYLAFSKFPSCSFSENTTYIYVYAHIYIRIYKFKYTYIYIYIFLQSTRHECYFTWKTKSIGFYFFKT